ncbi:unnamed protein product [Arctogadus glacialis]
MEDGAQLHSPSTSQEKVEGEWGLTSISQEKVEEEWGLITGEDPSRRLWLYWWLRGSVEEPSPGREVNSPLVML